MEVLILIPALLLFLFFLYKLSADDHVLIRKNISLEQMFDVAFSTFWISLIISRIYYFIFEAKQVGNLFIAFFTTQGGLSLTGAMVSAVASLYLISKYKKVPLGRLFDFFALSLLFALPVGYVGITLFHLKDKLILIIPYLVCAVVYLTAAILFRKFLYPKLLNRTLKEGNISLYFLLLFSVTSFGTSFVNFGKLDFMYFTVNNVILLGLFVMSIILLIKQEKGKLRRRAA
jgi:prolipoprotein diacylglyceryltransferase